MTSPENKQTTTHTQKQQMAKNSKSSLGPFSVPRPPLTRGPDQAVKPGKARSAQEGEEQKVADQKVADQKVAKWDENLAQGKVRLETQTPDQKKQALWLEATDGGAGSVLNPSALAHRFVWVLLQTTEGGVLETVHPKSPLSQRSCVTVKSSLQLFDFQLCPWYN